MLWRPDIHPDEPPYRVLLKRGEITDNGRNRTIPYKITYPSDANDPCPVIIWSHGLGGSRDAAGFLARYLAGHGFISVNIQHEGTDSGLWEGKEGHPWDVIRNTEIPFSAYESRYADVPAIMSRLDDIFAEHELTGLADFSRLGMAGHSLGALTTQMMAGQIDPRLESLKLDRFMAFLAYSPVPVKNADYGPIDGPIMYMTGTEDDSPLENTDYTARLPVYEDTKGRPKYLLVLEEGDHMVFVGSRGQLGYNANQEAHEEMIRIISHAFWAAYLREDQDAQSWLETMAASWLGRRADLKSDI